MGDEIIVDEGRLVSLAEVKEMLLKAQEEREELTYEQKLALEHSQRFAELTVEQTQALIEELKGLGFLNETYVYRVADLLPKHADDVKLIFAKSKQTISDDETTKILETVAKHA